MSFTRTNQSNAYLNAQFITKQKTTGKCRQISNGFYPSFTPILSDLSVTTSIEGDYSLVYVNGSNFLPNGTTYIKFGNYGYLSAIFYSSFDLSFVVPSDAGSGNYFVSVVNLYNGNFSPPVNQSYTANLNFSNSITYSIT